MEQHQAAYSFACETESKILSDLVLLGFDQGMLRDTSFSTRLNCLNYLRTVKTGIELLEQEILGRS